MNGIKKVPKATNEGDRNVNVTLAKEQFAGKPFPCPVCGESLLMRVAQTGKPYCHCDECGIQMFFRGAAGIRRLRRLLDDSSLTSGASRATLFYNRLQQLKEQKQKLEEQQGFVFADPDLERAIEKLEIEIALVRKEFGEL